MMLKEIQHSAPEDSNHILSSACLSAPITDLAWAGARPLGHTYFIPSPISLALLPDRGVRSVPAHPSLLLCVPSAPWVYLP